MTAGAGALGDPSPEIPVQTRRAWMALAEILPRELYLVGGTALASHLHHRENRDLDFFFHRASVHLGDLETRLRGTGRFAATRRDDGALHGLFDTVKIEFFHADEVATQRPIDKPTVVAGLRVAGVRDLMAMKLKVVGERGELRDYFDIKTIEERTGLQVEDGLALFAHRYGLDSSDAAIARTVQALGYLDDVEDDDLLPVDKAELAAWWAERQARLVRRLGRFR